MLPGLWAAGLRAAGRAAGHDGGAGPPRSRRVGPARGGPGEAEAPEGWTRTRWHAGSGPEEGVRGGDDDGREQADKDMCDVDLELDDEVQEAAVKLPLLSLQTTKLSFSTLIGVLFKLAFKYKFLLPSFFPLVVRSVSSLEGVALSVDPEFKLVAAGMPVVLNQLLSDRRPASEELLKELLFLPGEKDALRADETTRQILQVWLSAAQQANKMDKLVGAGIQSANDSLGRGGPFRGFDLQQQQHRR